MTCRPEEEVHTAADGAADFKGKEVLSMPAFDGTGPGGMGPMTGWGRGYCGPYPVDDGRAPVSGPAYGAPAYGRGFGYGSGFRRGRGFGRGFGPRTGWGRGFGRGRGWRGASPAWRGW